MKYHNQKYIFAFLVIFCMVLGLTSCKKNAEVDNSSSEISISDNGTNSEEITEDNKESEEVKNNKDVHVHSYNSTVIEPTCVSAGYTKHTCECGDAYNDNTEAQLGHSYGSWKVTKEATETSTGLKVRSCSRCGAKDEFVINKIISSVQSTPSTTNKTELTPGEKEYSESLGITEEELKEKLDAVDTCKNCGGKNGPYHYWYKDVTCPNCGESVPANTCHTCK